MNDLMQRMRKSAARMERRALIDLLVSVAVMR